VQLNCPLDGQKAKGNERTGFFSGNTALGQLIREAEIIAVGGGKGGVGKSFVASNLAILLARSQKQVVLVDADLGGANLHTWLGINPPETSLSDFINDSSLKLDDVMTATPLENLQVISGAQDFLGIANPKYTQKLRLLRALQNMQGKQALVLDLGAGTTINTLDFFLLADKGVLVVLPEPTSIENAYRFLKSVFYRKIKLMANSPKIKDLVERAMDRRNDLGIKTPVELLDVIERMDPQTGEKMRAVMERFRPKLILNQVRSYNDIRIGLSMKSACLKYFGIHLDFLGYLENDDVVWQSVRKRQPLALNGEHNRIARSLRTIVYNLVNNQEMRPE